MFPIILCCIFLVTPEIINDYRPTIVTVQKHLRDHLKKLLKMVIYLVLLKLNSYFLTLIKTDNISFSLNKIIVRKILYVTRSENI